MPAQFKMSAGSPQLTRKVLLSLLSALIIQFPATTQSKSTSPETRVVCYYTNWSAYRQGPAKFLPDNINPYLCTHLIYAFGGLTSDSGIKPFDKYQDIDKGGYTKFNGLKTYNKALKTLLAIGGWNEGSGRFSRLVGDQESRKSFIKNSIRFLRQHHFDGLDLDWEYPSARDGGEPADKRNYALFIKELREAFEDESKATGRTRLLLTIAVPAGIEWIQKGFDIPTINRNVDFFNLLTYDFHASTEPAANHHAPLRAKDGYSDYDYKSQLNIEYAINYYLDEGADADKLVVGLPTYGRSYTLFNPDNTVVGAPASGPGTKGKYTKEPGYLAYYEICEGIKSGEWRVENDQSDHQGPHAVKDDQWVGYDDTRTMGIKAKWVRDQNLGGIMFWSIDNDDFRGYCDGKAYPLIEAAKIAYYTGESPNIQKNPTKSGNSRLSSSPRKPTSTPAPPSTTTVAAVTSRKKLAKKTTTRQPRRRKVKPTTSRTTTTQPTAAISDPLRTPPPPTTPETSVDFECKDDGFFGHPKDCKKYFWCLDAPGLGLVAHHFTCPAGLFFNKNTDSCDYARNVPCKPGGTTTTTSTTPATTTTTTTTPSPPEEQYEYYDDDEESEEEPKKPEVKALAPKVKSASSKTAQEVQDIRNLLGIIRKLGGVEELEKYLEANPDLADEVEEYEDEAEEEPSTTEKPKPAKIRFSLPSKKFTPRPYSTIQRDRFIKSDSPVSTTTTTDKPAARPKYVTLSREKVNIPRNTNGKSDIPSSSTETSIVVRFSNEEKLIEETTTPTSKPITYVTSVPYSKVNTDREVAAASEERLNSKYSTFARPKFTTTSLPESSTVEPSSKPTTSTEEPQTAEDEEYEEDYAEDQPVSPSSTTIAPTTSSSTTTAKPTPQQRNRIPARNRPKFKSPTTTTTTTEPTTTKVTYKASNNFSASNRRNALFERRRGSSTTEPSDQSKEKESISSSEAVDVIDRNPFKESRRRSSKPTTATPEPQTRFRSRFRTSTTTPPETFDNFRRESTSSTTLGPLPSIFQSAVIRRRTRKPLTIASTTITTTSTSSSTTPKPVAVTLDPKVSHVVPIPDSNDYYYYVYEDDDDLLDKSQSQSAPSASFARRSLDYDGVDHPKITESPKTVVPLSDKLRILSNGSVECRDTGIYAHPNSCGRSYIRCVQNDNGIGIKGWLYSCPRSLTFDPIGAMCNWAANQRDGKPDSLCFDSSSNI